MTLFERMVNISVRESATYALLLAAFFEIYFLYHEVGAFIYWGVPTLPLWWLSALIKIGLGYAVYRLYIAGSRKMALLGAVLAVTVLGTIYGVFSVGPGDLSLIVGGSYIFLITTNSLFLYHYFRYPELAKTRGGKYSRLGLTITMGLLVWGAITGDSFVQLGVMFIWVVFYLDAEGVIFSGKED